MRPRLSLSFKVALLALANVLLLTVMLLMFASFQFDLSFESFLQAPSRDHIQSVRDELGQVLQDSPASMRKEWLDRFSKEYNAAFYLVDPQGRSLQNTPAVDLPQPVVDELLRRRRGPPQTSSPAVQNPGANQGLMERLWSYFARTSSAAPNPATTQGPGSRPSPPNINRIPFFPGLFTMKTENPRIYWAGTGMRIRSSDRTGPEFEPGWMLLKTDSLFSPFIFDPKPWIAVTLAVILVSVIVWLPLIRRLTHAVSEMTAATGQIAEGQFDIRLKVGRTDEVGQLASSINQMSTQLDGFVKGQKRFLADIAHELCAPVARMQMALGILEQRADETQREYVADVQDEAQHMSTLINELLSFSKAGMQVGETEIVPVPLAATVRRVLEREVTNDARVESAVTNDVEVLANPDHLFRALSNLVRNAIRYAGHAGPISVSAHNEGHDTIIVVSDFGPGLPEDALENIFAPFFRLERSRGRNMGGTGLGLAIVRACVEACKGSVHAHNRKPTGLEVEIRLRTATQVA